MCSLFIIGQMRANSLRHHQNQRPIIHVELITATDKFIVGVAGERAIGLTAKVGLIKAAHASPSRGRLPRLT